MGKTRKAPQFPPVLLSSSRFLNSAGPTISELGTGYNLVESRRSLAQKHCNFKQRNVLARKHLPVLKQATLISNIFA